MKTKLFDQKNRIEGPILILLIAVTLRGNIDFFFNLIEYGSFQIFSLFMNFIMVIIVAFIWISNHKNDSKTFFFLSISFCILLIFSRLIMLKWIYQFPLDLYSYIINRWFPPIPLLTILLLYVILMYLKNLLFFKSAKVNFEHLIGIVLIIDGFISVFYNVSLFYWTISFSDNIAIRLVGSCYSVICGISLLSNSKFAEFLEIETIQWIFYMLIGYYLFDLIVIFTSDHVNIISFILIAIHQILIPASIIIIGINYDFAEEVEVHFDSTKTATGYYDSYPYRSTNYLKSCGNCGKSISQYSTAGQRCPYCGVFWSAERLKPKNK